MGIAGRPIERHQGGPVERYRNQMGPLERGFLRAAWPRRVAKTSGRILEIGAGLGQSFPYYLAEARVTPSNPILPSGPKPTGWQATRRPKSRWWTGMPTPSPFQMAGLMASLALWCFVRSTTPPRHWPECGAATSPARRRGPSNMSDPPNAAGACFK